MWTIRGVDEERFRFSMTIANRRANRDEASSDSSTCNAAPNTCVMIKKLDSSMDDCNLAAISSSRFPFRFFYNYKCTWRRYGCNGKFRFLYDDCVTAPEGTTQAKANNSVQILRADM